MRKYRSEHRRRAHDPVSAGIAIRSRPPQPFAEEAAPLGLFSPGSPPSGRAEERQSCRPSSVAIFPLHAHMPSQEDGIFSIQHSGANDPVDYSWYTQLNETIIPTVLRGSSGFEPHGTPEIRSLYPCNTTAGDSHVGKDDRFSANNNIFGLPHNPRIQSSVHASSFATMIIPIISRMLSNLGSLASVIPMGVGSVLESAILNVSHPGASQLLKRQTVDQQFIYLIFHRLINDGNVDQALIKPRTKLDHFFNMGVTFCFSLGKKALGTIINSTPPPYNSALKQNLFRVALITGHEHVLNVVLNMGQGSLVNRPVILGDDQYFPLEYTSLYGHIQATQALLYHGADPNRQCQSRFYERIGRLPDTRQSNDDSRTQILRLLLGHNFRIRTIQDVFREAGCKDEVLLLATHFLERSFDIFFSWCNLPKLLLQPHWDESLVMVLKRILDRASSDRNRNCTIWNQVLSESLSCAVRRSYVSAVEVLLAIGAKLNINCLISAACSDNLKILKDSLSLGLDPNATWSKPFPSHVVYNLSNDPEYRNDGQDTALSESIRNRSEGAFGVLQSRGFILALAIQPAGFVSALIAACEVGDITLVEQLLSLQIDPQRLQMVHRALEVTVAENHSHILKRLLSVGIRPTRDSLISAIQKRQLATVELLANYLDLSNELAIQYSDHDCIMFEALRWNNQRTIEHVLRMGHPINILMLLEYSQMQDWNLPPSLRLSGDTESWALTPLSAALLQGDSKAIEALMAHGAQVVFSFVQYDISSYGVVTSTPFTPLAAAAVRHDIDLIKNFLRMGADPFDNSALFVCAVLSLETVITLVLSAFRNRYPDGVKDFGSEALCYVIRHNNMRLIGLLARDTDILGHIKIKDDRHYDISFRTDPMPPPPPPGWSSAFMSPLGEAIRLHSTCSGTDEMLDLLLPLVKDLNAVVYSKSKHGTRTCLTHAIVLGSLKTVQRLHQAGADISLPAEWGNQRTPLQVAAQTGSMEIVEYLLGQGVNPNEAPAKKAGGTALQLAAIKGHIGIAAALLDVGAEINAKPAVMDGRTAFEGATEHGRIEMMLFLVHHGADILGDDSRQYRRAVLFAEDNLQYAAKELADQLHAKAMASAGTCFIGMSECGWTGFDLDDVTEFFP